MVGMRFLGKRLKFFQQLRSDKEEAVLTEVRVDCSDEFVGGYAQIGQLHYRTSRPPGWWCARTFDRGTDVLVSIQSNGRRV